MTDVSITGNNEYPTLDISLNQGQSQVNIETTTTQTFIEEEGSHPSLVVNLSQYPSLTVIPAPEIKLGGGGEVGPVGPRGVQGIQGIQGVQGIQGSLGIQGIQGTSIQGIQGVQGIQGAASQGLTWPNPNPTTTTVGGLPTGSTLLGDTTFEILEKILYPYVSVSFSSFSVNLASGNKIFEVGQNVSPGTKNVTWSTSGPDSNWLTSTIVITRKVNSGSSTILLSGLNYDDSPQSFTHPNYQYNIPTSLIFGITGNQVQGSNPELSETYNWKYKMYWGCYTGEGLTGADVPTIFSSAFVDSTTTTGRLFTGNGIDQNYFYFLIPQSFTPYVNFYRSVNGNPAETIPFDSEKTTIITNSQGLTLAYKYYRSINSSATTSLTIIPTTS